jgi:hypothetical protein
MVKIEQIKDAKVFVTRDGVRRQVFLHQLITRQEAETLEVEGGSVLYSIDEQELVTKEAPKPAAVEAPPTPKRTAKQIAQEAKAKLEAGE